MKMRKMIKRVFAMSATIAVVLSSFSNVYAEEKPYLALGEDLNSEQKSTVLNLLGVDEDSLDEYDVVYVNNKEEHEYLDSYISASEIGTKSLSSVVITKAKAGEGLHFSIYNINYCTVGMYKNACTTAGVDNANITIAGPINISGTAALVGIFKAYHEMTGEEIDEEIVDAALDELVTTGELEHSMDADSEDVEAMIAELKGQLSELDTKEDIIDAIKDTSEKYEIKISDEQLEELTALLVKLKDLDLDWDSIKDQAKEWKNTLENLDTDDVEGFWANLIKYLKELLESLKNLFK